MNLSVGRLNSAGFPNAQRATGDFFQGFVAWGSRWCGMVGIWVEPMAVTVDQISKKQMIPHSKSFQRRICLSCGTDQIKPRRRYCSKECRHQIAWVLWLSKGLLRTFNIRYAAFSFTRDYVILDMLPVWSKEISRFTLARTPGKKPASDLKNLVLESGKEWHHLVGNNNSKTSASIHMLMKKHNKDLDPRSIHPKKKTKPRLSRHERTCLKILQLERDDLIAEGHHTKIKSAYKRLAKLYHPDMGGDEEKFKQLNEAHKQMLLWTRNPQYTSRKALAGCWSYDGFTNRWSPPL